MKQQLEPGDRVRVIAFTCGHVPRKAVGRVATVTATNNFGGVYLQDVKERRDRYYVPPDSVGACLELVTP